MKMRRFFQGSNTDDEESQESAAVATLDPESTEPAEETGIPGEPDAKGSHESVVAPAVPVLSAGDEANAHRMRDAFAGVAAAVDGEVESLRRALADFEKTLNRAVDGERHARNHAVDGIKQNLSSRIDEVVAGRERIVGELKLSVEQERKRVDGCVDELKQAAGRERERIDGRLDELKTSIHQSIDTKIDKLSKDVDALGKNLNALQLELQRQADTSQKVTAVLNNMAGALAGNQAQPNPPVSVAAAGTETGSPAEVDDALERVFK